MTLGYKDLRNPKALFASVRKAFPSSRSSRRAAFQPLPAVRLENGALVTTRADRLARWRAYFGQQEAAEEVDQTQYTRYFAQPDIPVLPDGAVFDIDAVPTLSLLEKQVLGVKAGKACGADGITGEIFKLAPGPLARALFPICLKAALGVREPCEWRGGNLLSLAKRASTALDCSGYRSILIENVPAKLHHRNLRDLLLPKLASYSDELQAGQLKGVGGGLYWAGSADISAMGPQHRTGLCTDVFRCEGGFLQGYTTGPGADQRRADRHRFSEIAP